VEISDGRTTTTLTPGDDGKLTPRQSVTIGDGRRPYVMPSGDRITLAKGEQLTVHFADQPHPDVVPPSAGAGGHRLLTETLLAGPTPLAHTVTGPGQVRVYDGTGALVAIRTEAGFIAAPGYEATSTRVSIGPSPGDGGAVVTTFHENGTAVLTVTTAGDRIALTAGDSLPQRSADWRIAVLDSATAATVVQVGILSAAAHGDLALSPHLRDALGDAVVRAGEAEPLNGAQLREALERELTLDTDPARSQLRQRILDMAARLESTTGVLADEVAGRQARGTVVHPDRLALVEAGTGLAHRTLDGLRSAYRDLLAAKDGTLAQLQARTGLERQLTLADQTSRALTDLVDHLDSEVHTWQHMAGRSERAPEDDPAYRNVFHLNNGHEFLGTRRSERELAERQERAAIELVRTWFERGQEQRLAQHLAHIWDPPGSRPAATNRTARAGAAEENGPRRLRPDGDGVRARLLVIDPRNVVLNGLMEMFPRPEGPPKEGSEFFNDYRYLLAEATAPHWTLPGEQEPLLLVAESGRDNFFSVPARALLDGTPIEQHHLDGRRQYEDLNERIRRARSNPDLRDLLTGAREAFVQENPWVQDEYWPYHGKWYAGDMVATRSSTSIPTVHVGGPGEHGVVAEEHALARQVIAVARPLRDIIGGLAQDPNPGAIAGSLYHAFREGTIDVGLYGDLVDLQRQAAPHPDELKALIDAFSSRGRLSDAQGALLHGVAGDAALFHEEVDRLAQAGVLSGVVDALHALGLKHGIDEIAHALELQDGASTSTERDEAMAALTHSALVADLFASDPREVLRDILDGKLRATAAVTNLLDHPLLHPFEREAVYGHLLDSLVDQLNRYPPDHLPTMDPPIDINGRPAEPGSALRTGWDDVVHDLQKIVQSPNGRPLPPQWDAVARAVRNAHEVPGLHYGPRGHDAETKLFYALARVFEQHPPAPGTQVVVMAEKAMCAGCQAAGQLLADRFGIRITVIDPPAEVDTIRSGLAIDPPGGHGGQDAHRRAIKAEPGVVNIVVHGNAEGLLVGGRRLSVEEFVDLVPPHSVPEGAVIRFLSCNLGGNRDLLHRLADIYGRPVVAADTTVWIDRLGRVIASDMVSTTNGTIPFFNAQGEPNGTWLEARPNDPNIYRSLHVPAAPDLAAGEDWASMSTGPTQEPGGGSHQIQIHSSEQEIRRAYVETRARIKSEFDQAIAESAAHQVQVRAEAAANPPPAVPVERPAVLLRQTELLHRLDLLHAATPPLEHVRRSIDAFRKLLKTRTELIQTLTKLADRPARQFTAANATAAEQTMRAITALDDTIRTVAGQPRFANDPTELRLTAEMPAGTPAVMEELALKVTRLSTVDADTWSPRLEIQGDRDLSSLHQERRDLTVRLEVSADLARLRRMVGTEASLVHVDRAQLRQEIAALDQRILQQTDLLRQFTSDVRGAARQLRLDIRSGADPIGDFLDNLGQPPLTPRELTALTGFVTPHISDWRNRVDHLNQALYDPTLDIHSPVFAPEKLAGATVTEWKQIHHSGLIPTAMRAHVVPLPEHRAAELSGHGEALPRGVPLLAMDHLAGWKAVLHGIGHGDLIGVLQGITGASRREIEPLRLEERTVTVDKASWREVRMVYQITEDRGSLAFPYTRKTRNQDVPGLPRPDLGIGQLKLKLTGRERVQFIPSGQIRARWERSIVERTLISDNGKQGFERYGRVVYDGPATLTIFEQPSVEVKQMLRAAAEVDVPLIPPLGPAGPQAGIRVGIEAMHTEHVPLPNGVEAWAQFKELVRQFAHSPDALTETGRAFWRDVANGTVGATGKQTFQLELYTFVKQNLFGDSATALGDASPLPFENFRELRFGHQWFTWNLKLPENTPAPIRSVTDAVGTLVTQAQTLVTNPTRGIAAVVPELPKRLTELLNKPKPPPAKDDDE
jgi:hypothetical protein